MSITILDGAMGTELQRRNYKTTLPLWSSKANLDAFDLVKEIHSDYVKAGADVITTNTFRTIDRTWEKVGKKEDAAKANAEAIRAALEVKKEFPNTKVAGSITTLEDCYMPELVPHQEELEKEHKIQVDRFKDSGIDIMLLETLNTLKESEVLLNYSQELGVPIWISFVTNPEGDLLSGEKLEDAVKLAEQYNVEAILLNCRSPKIISVAAEKLSKAFSGKKGIYANGAGHPHDDQGWEFNTECPPDEYLKNIDKWIELGFEIVGGCCGTNPEYIKQIADKYKKS